MLVLKSRYSRDRPYLQIKTGFITRRVGANDKIECDHPSVTFLTIPKKSNLLKKLVFTVVYILVSDDQITLL